MKITIELELDEATLNDSLLKYAAAILKPPPYGEGNPERVADLNKRIVELAPMKVMARLAHKLQVAYAQLRLQRLETIKSWGPTDEQLAGILQYYHPRRPDATPDPDAPKGGV